MARNYKVSKNMSQRWYQKATVQAAFVAGVFTVITAITVGLFNSFSKDEIPSSAMNSGQGSTDRSISSEQSTIESKSAGSSIKALLEPNSKSKEQGKTRNDVYEPAASIRKSKKNNSKNDQQPAPAGDIKIENSPGAVAQYMINSPNSVQINTDNLTVVQNDENDVKNRTDAYFLKIYKDTIDSLFVMEIWPQNGAWTPFFCAVPVEEAVKISPRIPGIPSLPITVIRGIKNKPPTSAEIADIHFDSTDDGQWTIAWSDVEATTTHSYYIFCQSLPSKIAFGVLDDSPQFVVDLADKLKTEKQKE